ncbi:TraB/GumN family protein [Massilia sp. 9096]|uniref:TraB/GumN family protein n=1 Tax=Massilia sp. 9096 TaxID=1500894 RepID=UPI00068D7AEA|nr:TraB/GumN family protein [Massilia sp. 9096]
MRSPHPHPFLRGLALLLGLFWLLPSAFAADRGALFKLTLHGHTMHLFGTMHVGRPEFYPLEPRIMTALAESSTLALEIDLNEAPDALQRDMKTYGLLPAGGKTYDSLPPARKQRLDALIGQAGLDPATALALKPVLLATMLTIAEYTRLGYRADLSSDDFLARTAHARHIRVIGLESLAQQLSILDRLPEAARWQFLEETMEMLDSGEERDEAKAILQAWSTADQRGLDQVMRQTEADRSVSGRFLADVLLKERNRGMAERLLALLQSEKQTVGAVGVLHLLGATGVPALLKARGVVVERVY